ncbi:MAG TPA: SDR family oxidoreductase [Lachnospiraceae bacterium]|nr:SDR family oxidoreductase [Lachnospiraceae bacterium]
MKVLFIGGTGTISMAISRSLLEQGHELYLLNRGSRNSSLPNGAHSIVADINDEAAVAEKIKDMKFDVIGEFIAFTPDQLERDYRLFKGKTNQFIFISSASAYQKPLSDYKITESTPLANPYWLYSRNKIACEEYLMKLYRDEAFPITIVRPSHTYDERSVPLGAHGTKGSYQVLKRMMEGKRVIVQGDGSSLWTMTHNSDFAKGYIGLMNNIHAIGEAVQITSDETLTWNQIYAAIARALGVDFKPYYVPSDFMAACGPNYDFTGGLIGDKSNSVVFDNRKLKRLVPGLAMTKRFDQGIKETIDYVLSHPECQTEDVDFDAWCDRVIKAMETAKETVLKKN